MAAKKKEKKDSAEKRLITHLSALLEEVKEKQETNTLLLEKEVGNLESVASQLVSSQSKLKRSEVNFDAFSAWMRKEAPDSFIDERFQFRSNFKEGSGVIAVIDLKDGQQFMSVPRKLCLTSEFAFTNSPLSSILSADPLCRHNPSLALAAALWFESVHPASFWRPYLDVLPHTLSLPIFWSMAELKTLQSSPILKEILRLKKATLRQYTHLYGVLKKGGGQIRGGVNMSEFTLARFRWAVGIVMSRQNRIPTRDLSDSMIALIPGWDMCNYSDGKLTTYFNAETDASESFTMTEIKKGQQIYIYYGDRPNSKLLIYQGFVYDHHRTDTCTFTISIDEKDPILKIKHLLLTKRGIATGSRTFTVPADRENAQYTELWVYLRIAALTKEEAAVVLKTPQMVESKLNDENETRAKSILTLALNSALAQYGTTVEDDLRVLETPDLSENVKLGVRYRISEKRMLQQMLEL